MAFSSAYTFALQLVVTFDFASVITGLEPEEPEIQFAGGSFIQHGGNPDSFLYPGPPVCEFPHAPCLTLPIESTLVSSEQPPDAFSLSISGFPKQPLTPKRDLDIFNIYN